MTKRRRGGRRRKDRSRRRRVLTFCRGDDDLLAWESVSIPRERVFMALEPLQLGVFFGSTRGHGGSLGAMVGHCYWSLLIILYVCNYCDGKNVLSSLQGGPPRVFGGTYKVCNVCMHH